METCYRRYSNLLGVPQLKRMEAGAVLISRFYYAGRKSCVRCSEYLCRSRSPCADTSSPVAGATEKIAALRNRYRQIGESVALYEDKVAKQQSKLERMNKSAEFGSQSQDEEEDYEEGGVHQAAEPTVTEDDLRLEEQEIKELELKKRTLEERVTGMEKDLGGLLR